MKGHLLKMKIQRLLLLILTTFTNRYDGSLGNQSTPQLLPVHRLASNPSSIMVKNAITNIPMNKTTTANTNTDIAVNTTTNPHVIRRCIKLEWESNVYFALLLLFVPAVFLDNLVVVVVVFNTRTLRDQPMYLFLVSLAVADCLIGIFLFPLRAKHLQDGYRFQIPPFLCWLFWLSDFLINIVSILHFVMVAVDRYIALKYTYDYSTMITCKQALLIIAFIWISGIVWVIIGIPQWTAISPKVFPDSVHTMSIYCTQKHGCGWWNPNYHISTLVLWVILPIILLSFLYSFIYRTALRHVNEISRLHIGEAEQIRQRKQLQLVRSIIAVFVSYAVCCLPVAVYTLWVYNNLDLARKLMCAEANWFRVLTFICAHLFIVVCPNANPFIYVLTNSAFVTALKRLFCKATGLELGKKNAIVHSAVMRKTDEVDNSYQMDGF